MVIKAMQLASRIDARLGANPLWWYVTIPYHYWKNVFLKHGQLDDPEHLQLISDYATSYGN